MVCCLLLSFFFFFKTDVFHCLTPFVIKWIDTHVDMMIDIEAIIAAQDLKHIDPVTAIAQTEITEILEDEIIHPIPTILHLDRLLVMATQKITATVILKQEITLDIIPLVHHHHQGQIRDHHEGLPTDIIILRHLIHTIPDDHHHL